jgi:hypothetical protein
MDNSRDPEQKEELAEVKNFLNQTLDVESALTPRKKSFKRFSRR